MNSAMNSSFSRVNPRLQIAHDATSIAAGMKCWRYYEYSIIEGYVPGARGQATDHGNEHIIFGHLFAAACELYARRIADGDSHAEAQRYVLNVLLVNTYDFVAKRPWESTIPQKSRKTLLRTFILYTDRFHGENLETVILRNGKPAVELSFRLEVNIQTSITQVPCHDCDGVGRMPDTDAECIYCGGLGMVGEEVLLCGHMDKIVDWKDRATGDSMGLWITDQKTSRYALDDRYFAQYSPNIQVSLYTLAGKAVFHKEVEGLIIDATQVLTGGSRFRRKEIYRDPEHLEEFMRDFHYYFRELERRVEENYFPMNPTACGFGNMICRYREVCSTSPAARQDVLNDFFTRRTWDPLQPR